MAQERFEFQAEVGRLLDIVANSLYTHKDVFLRELISNASDACDRLRYAALTEPELTADDADLRIRLRPDAKARTLTIADNGIGMTREELIEDLGTVARSGTAAFVDRLTSEAAKDTQLIGQFGVGFYAAFMVADRIEVVTRKAGTDKAWRWESDGRSGFTIKDAGEAPRGTQIIVHLREGEETYLEPETLRRVVTTYSDHIAFPILLEPEKGNGAEAETLNAASALWTRPKSEIGDEQYKEFYHHVAHAFDEPWLTLHVKAEGVIEYTALLFIPSIPSLDLFHPDRRHCVKLYVRRVFITDQCEGMLPGYLRFVRGVVDSQDLPLNISRETLQHNPVLAKIRSGLTKRILGRLAEKAEKEPESYAGFWTNFGAVLKEGIYEDMDRRDELLALSRFRTTAGTGLVSLADYVGRMREGQTEIFYITGDDAESLARSPQLEGFRARGVEVLLLTDPVDEFWVPAVGGYEGRAFRSITRGDVDLSAIAAGESDEAAEGKKGDKEKDKSAPAGADRPGLDRLLARFRETLGESVKDVRVSGRLTDSPVCLVADEAGMDLHLERLLRQHRQLDAASPRILEINPDHPLIARLAAVAAGADHAASASANPGADEKPDEGGAAEGAPPAGADDTLAEAARLLLDQARIVEGESVPDPAAFSRRLTRFMEQGLGGLSAA